MREMEIKDASLHFTSILNLGRVNNMKRPHVYFSNSSLRLTWTNASTTCVLTWPRNHVVPKTGRKLPVLEQPNIRTTRINPILNRVQPFWSTFTHIALPLHALRQMSLPTTLLPNSTEENIRSTKLNEMNQQSLAGEPRGSGMGAHEDLMSFPRRLCTR